MLMPVSAFRLGFTNGLMSESMIIWFGIMLIREIMEKNKEDSLSREEMISNEYHGKE